MNKREWMLQAALAWIASPASPGTSGVVKNLSDMYDAIIAAAPDQADEGWIEHRGEKPYPEGKVDVEYRTGVRVQGADADDYDWTHDEDLGDFVITRWRTARA